MIRRAKLVALTVEDYCRETGQAFGRMRVRKIKSGDSQDEKFRHVAPAAVERLEVWLRAAGSRKDRCSAALRRTARANQQRWALGR
jgi:hypothetical protein